MITIPEFVNAHLTNHNNIIDTSGIIGMDVGVDVDSDSCYRGVFIIPTPVHSETLV